MMDPNLTGIIIVGIIALIPISIVAVTKITDMKLKIEQLKAETAIKTEEIQAKNRLDIEKLIMRDGSQLLQDEQKKNFAISEDAGIQDADNCRKKIDA